MEEKIYYDDDADIEIIRDQKIGVVGYGIQGRAQAQNLKDSGLKVCVANRSDNYVDQIKEDNMELTTFDSLAKESDIILFLIPDQAQKEVYEKYLSGNMKPGSLLIFAHGYALRYKTITIDPAVNVGLLAPRMPGFPIRNSFLNNGGVPAFIDAVNDPSGNTLARLLAIAKGTGFTRAGVLEVDYKTETELDLFIEQFLVAAIVKGVSESFNILVNEFKFPKVATLMELYASSEFGDVLKEAANVGIGKVFQDNASPTCQFGIAKSFETSMSGDIKDTIRNIISGIKDGSFADELEVEGNNEYPQVGKLWNKVNSPALTQTQDWINQHFKRADY